MGFLFPPSADKFLRGQRGERMKRFLIIAFFLSLSLSAIAEEVDVEEKEEELKGIELPMIIITPTKYETPIYGIPSSFTVIYEDEILSKGKPQVKDILKEIPGVHIVQGGSFGSVTSIFTRGTESNHTLVMIDGVKVFDPMLPGGMFNFAHMTLDNVERVEVLRGPHSTLYGSDAIGGVVNVITKKGMGKPKFWTSFEGGSFSTFKESAGSYGEINNLHYSLSLSRFDTEGISQADEGDGNDERDAYANTSFSSRFDCDLSELITVGSTFRYTNADIEVDDARGAGGDDPNRRNKIRENIISAYMDLDLNDWWTVDLRCLWMDIARYGKDYKDFAAGIGEYLNSKYEGRNISYELHNIFKLGDFGTLSAGIDYDKQRGDSFYDSYYYSDWLGAYTTYTSDLAPVKNHNVGYYLQNKFDMGDNFHSIAGFRIDDHSEFGLHDTYKISAKYIFDWGTSVRGTWATGFRAPSLSDLYDPQWGNPNLEPEESETYEVGLGQNLMDDHIQLESTYFYTDLDNLIESRPPTYTPLNINNARIYGIENLVMLDLMDKVKLNYTYTYLNTRDETTRQRLLRRPMHKHVFSFTLTPIEKLNCNLTYLYVGDRKDVGYVTVKHYHVVDVSGRYVVNDNFELFGRVENLLNKGYQEIDGYGTPGISFYGGGKVTF